ncbi:MAG: CCDC90 family protein [Magnetococcus sp. MYC-9]
MSTATSTESGYKSATFVFDSYAYVRRLRDAGMDEQQAAIQAETFMAMAEDRLATKQDIAEIKRDIETTKAELKRDIAAVDAKVETTKAELKRDIAAIDAKVETTKAELKRDIETTRTELQKDIAKDIALARVTTIQWTAGMFAAQTALVLGALFATGRVGQPTAQQPVYQPPAQELRQPAPPVPPAPPAR